MIKFYLFTALLVCNITQAQDTTAVNAGDSAVYFITNMYAADSGTRQGVYFIYLHENETTALRVTKEFLQSRSGTLISLHQNGERYIYFTRNNKLYMVDPNRIFSRAGTQKYMRKLAAYNAVVGREVKKLADTILSKLRKPKLVIAVHNNMDGKPLSTKNYTGRKAFRTYINKEMDADDFVLTTERKVFNHLKKKNISVILELPSANFNDGSLSVYCNRRRIPYINIEAEDGHAAAQLAMLQALEEVIKSYE